MKTITRTYYECEICGEQYRDESAAIKCESVPMRRNKDVCVGDIVTITAGEGRGKEARVTGIGVLSPRDANGYKEHIHTVCLTVDIINGWGSRDLMWDCYTTSR